MLLFIDVNEVIFEGIAAAFIVIAADFKCCFANAADPKIPKHLEILDSGRNIFYLL